MSTDITTTSTSTSLVKRAGLIALFAVLALLMGAKFTGALVSGPTSGGHGSSAAYTSYAVGLTPGAPTNVSASSTAAGAVTVSWLNPASTGVPITSFTVTNGTGGVVYCSTSTITAANAANSCTWTPTSPIGGLIHVRANGSGLNTPDAGSYTLYTPAAPTVTAANGAGYPTVGNGTITVAYATGQSTFNAANPVSNANNPLAVTQYQVLYNGTTVVCTTTSATYCVINNATAGLTSGSAYQFTVVAVNPAGNSTASGTTPASTTVTAVSAPAAPTNATATVDLVNGTLNINYTSSASNGGDTLAYTVSGFTAPNPSTGAVTAVSYAVDTNAAHCSTSLVTSLAITGAKCAIKLSQLSTDGMLPHSGSFTVTATQTTALLSASVATNSVSIGNVPLAPTAVNIVATGVWFTSSDATTGYGFNIQLQTCTAAVLNTTCTNSGSPKFVSYDTWNAGAAGSGKDSTHPYLLTFAGGANYNVAVSEVNTSGAVGPQTVSTSNYPVSAGAPSQPVVSITSVTNGSLTAAFTAPASANGSAILSYTLSLVNNYTVVATKTLTAAGSWTFSGLTPTGSYSVKVAVNYGTGPSTSTPSGTAISSAVTVGPTPAAPQLTYTATGVTASWTAAVAPYAVTSYSVLSLGTGAVLCTSTGTSCTIDGATAAKLLASTVANAASIAVYTTDANGTTSNIGAGTSLLAIGAPASVTAYKNATGDVNVAWVANTGIAGGTTSTPATYTVQALGTDGSVKTVSVSGTTKNYLFAGLLAGTVTYSYQVQAVNGVGASSQTAIAGLTSNTAVTAAATPVIITSTSTVPGSPSLSNPLGGQDAATAFTSLTTGAVGQANSQAAANAIAAAGIASLLPQAAPNSGGHVVTVLWWPGTAVTGNAVSSYTATLTEASGLTLTCQVTPSPLPAQLCTFFGVPTNQTFTVTVVANAPLGNSTLPTSTNASAAGYISIVNPGEAGPVTGLTAAAVAGTSAGTMAIAGSFTAPTNATAGTTYTISVTNNVTGDIADCTPGVSSTTGTTSKYACTGLTNNTSYTISVLSVSSLLGSVNSTTTASNTASATAVTTPTIPSRPAAPIVAPVASNTLSVTWTAPTTGGSPITSYVVTSSAAFTACTAATGTTVTPTGSTVETLTASAGYTSIATTINCAFASSGTSVTFTVAAVNAVATSKTSLASTTIKTLATPTAPANAYFVKDASGFYTLGWSSSAATGATSYIVYANGGGSPLAFPATTTNLVIPAASLVANTNYTFNVAGVNAAGTGSQSGDAIAGVIPAVPTGLVYNYNGASAATSTSLTLTWTPAATADPTTTTALPVTYSVYANVSNVWTVLASGLTSATYTTPVSATTSGYKVYALNVAGISGTGVTSYTTAVAQLAPSAPSAAVVTTTARTASLSWTPGSGTVATLNAVSVTVSGSDGSTVACPSLTAASSSCSFTTLLPGVTYSYSITNSTVYGTSTALVGTFTTKYEQAAAPTITGAVAGASYSAVTGANYSITLTWTAPTSTGGAPITGYVVSVSHGTTTFCAAVLTAASTTCTINGLTASATYTYSVAATTAYGVGLAAASDSSKFTATADPTTTVDASYPFLPANDPTFDVSKIVLSYPAYGSVKASWTAGDGLSSNSITGYVCAATATGYTTVKVSAAADATDCTLTGLSNVEYTISVTALTDAGTLTGVAANGIGNAVTPLYPTTAGANGSNMKSSAYINNSPANFGGLSAVGGTISAQWAAPVVIPNGNNSAAITSYVVTATDAAGNVFTCNALATDRLCTVKGLANNTKYTVVVTPVNAVGNSTVVASLAITTLAGTAPAAPTAVNATRTVNGLSVSWTAPATAGSGQLVGYWVTATDVLSTQQYSCGYNAAYGLLLAPATTCSIAGLTVGNNYNVSITAITQDGAGNKQLSTPATKLGVTYASLSPEPVMATFQAVTAMQKSVSALSANAKSALNNLISTVSDGAKITITGYGTTKAIALARANAAANYLFNNGAAVHVTVKSVISKTIKTALVTVTSN